MAAIEELKESITDDAGATVIPRDLEVDRSFSGYAHLIEPELLVGDGCVMSGTP